MTKRPHSPKQNPIVDLIYILTVGSAEDTIITELHAHQPSKRSSPRSSSRSAQFLRLGYKELSGNETLRFVTGNTIVFQNADAPKWLRSLEDNKEYYFRDADNVIECQPVDTGCVTFRWGLKDNKICLSLPFGAYIEFGDNVQSIVKSNATVANFTDTNLTAQFIEVGSKDFASEIRATKDRADAHSPTEIRVKDPRAASVMIGDLAYSRLGAWR